MTGKAIIIRSDARNLPLPDSSVDLIVTSPPYFGLRSYRDNGEHYEGQVGSEATPQEFLQALWGCMQEWWRILKPEGSCFVNLGDKRAGSGGHNNSGVSHNGTGATTLSGGKVKLRQLADAGGHAATRRNAPDRYNQASFGRTKSKMLIPHRFAIGCEDGLADPEGIGWVMRQDLIWQKLNGLPESVTDRHRDSHEYIFHFTKQERYFAAMDEIRQAHARAWDERNGGSFAKHGGKDSLQFGASGNSGAYPKPNPLGALPGSVWPMASEPLLIPQWAKDKYGLGDHFAAFPTELPRKLILGFSPSGICVECGEPRRPVVEKELQHVNFTTNADSLNGETIHKNNRTQHTSVVGRTEATITGYACACPTPEAPTRPSVILDPFGGTGTVAMVAKGLGRIGISNDLSQDYCNLARWRIEESGHGKKAEQRTWGERQETFL